MREFSLFHAISAVAVILGLSSPVLSQFDNGFREGRFPEYNNGMYPEFNNGRFPEMNNGPEFNNGPFHEQNGNGYNYFGRNPRFDWHW